MYAYVHQSSTRKFRDIICECVHGFHSIPSDIIGWSCKRNIPELDACNGSYSNWDGVECNDNYIIGVKLSSFGIEGTLSLSFGALIYLVYLQLDYNNLISTIPSTLG